MMSHSSPILRSGLIASLVMVLMLLSGAPRAQAQIGDAGEILRAGAGDATLLMENYLKPFGAGFGANLNAGWVNMARPHQPFGFDLRVNAGLAFVPSSDRLFNVNNVAFQELQLLSGSAATPTISGDDFTDTRLGRNFTYEDPNTGQNVTEELYSFMMPEGIGFPYVPAPMVQLTVGAVMDTDVSFRYFPSTQIDDVGSIGMFGIGAKHGLNQWLPGGNTLPVDLSVQLGYTRLTMDASFEVLPDIDGETHVPQGYESNAARWRNQGMDFVASGFTGNVLVGKTFPVLSLFGGLGFQSSNVSITTPGSYPITVPNENYDPNAASGSPNSKPKIVESIESPIDLSLDGENSVHALAGFRIRLSLLTISGSYTLAKYPVANVGVGFSFR